MQSRKDNTYKALLDTRKKAIALAAGIFLAAVLTVFFFFTFERKASLIFPDCMLRTATGIKCFLCGGTRCAREIVRGNIGKAFYYNPYAVLLGLSLLVWYIRLVVSILRKNYRPLRLSEGYLWVVLAGAAVFFVVRNFDFYQSVFY